MRPIRRSEDLELFGCHLQRGDRLLQLLGRHRASRDGRRPAFPGRRRDRAVGGRRCHRGQAFRHRGRPHRDYLSHDRDVAASALPAAHWYSRARRRVARPRCRCGSRAPKAGPPACGPDRAIGPRVRWWVDDLLLYGEITGHRVHLFTAAAADYALPPIHFSAAPITVSPLKQ